MRHDRGEESRGERKLVIRNLESSGTHGMVGSGREREGKRRC